MIYYTSQVSPFSRAHFLNHVSDDVTAFALNPFDSAGCRFADFSLAADRAFDCFAPSGCCHSTGQTCFDPVDLTADSAETYHYLQVNPQLRELPLYISNLKPQYLIAITICQMAKWSPVGDHSNLVDKLTKTTI